MKFEKSSEECLNDAMSIERKLSRYPIGQKLSRDDLKNECASELDVDERITLNIWLSSKECTWVEKLISVNCTTMVGFVRTKV